MSSPSWPCSLHPRSTWAPLIDSKRRCLQHSQHMSMDHPGLWNRYQEEATQGWQHHSASEAEQRHSSSSPHQRHPPWSPAAEHEAQLPARARQPLLVHGKKSFKITLSSWLAAAAAALRVTGPTGSFVPACRHNST